MPLLSRSQSFSFFGDEGQLKVRARAHTHTQKQTDSAELTICARFSQNTERPQFPAQPPPAKAAADPEHYEKRLPRFNDDKHVGPNALVLLQALTGGHRTWVGAPPGSKSLGQVMDEMARMEAGLTMADPLQQLELREHSLALRAQKFGIWSDPVRSRCATAPTRRYMPDAVWPACWRCLLSQNHTPNAGYVTEQDLFTLVAAYNKVVGLRPDLR